MSILKKTFSLSLITTAFTLIFLPLSAFASNTTHRCPVPPMQKGTSGASYGCGTFDTRQAEIGSVYLYSYDSNYLYDGKEIAFKYKHGNGDYIKIWLQKPSGSWIQVSNAPTIYHEKGVFTIVVSYYSYRNSSGIAPNHRYIGVIAEASGWHELAEGGFTISDNPPMTTTCSAKIDSASGTGVNAIMLKESLTTEINAGTRSPEWLDIVFGNCDAVPSHVKIKLSTTSPSSNGLYLKDFSGGTGVAVRISDRGNTTPWEPNQTKSWYHYIGNRIQMDTQLVKDGPIIKGGNLNANAIFQIDYN